MSLVYQLVGMVSRWRDDRPCSNAIGALLSDYITAFVRNRYVPYIGAMPASSVDTIRIRLCAAL
jgi:hypothetical protein